MKKIIGITALLLIAGFCSAFAQSETKKAATSVKKAVGKVGDKTAEVAVKGKAVVVDKVYKDKQGPEGQTIYIDRHSKYYWVDKKGHNIYVDKNKLASKQ
jgi:outer membrane lipoprotein-sorting protein